MKARIRLAALLLLATVITGCSPDGQRGTESAQSAPPAANAEGQPRQLKKALPYGIQLGFAYHLRRDRVEEVKAGTFQRRIRVEYLDLGQQQAADAITADLTAAGYQAGAPKRLDDGRIRIAFKQEKRRTIAVTIREGGKLQHPSAKGMIYINIPVKAPTSKADAAAAQ